MNSWLHIDFAIGAPAFNMALDEGLLEAAPRLQKPVLRFYGWTESAATFGYFQKFAEIERATMLRPLIRRPTGGGLVPHDADWTYSLVFPPDHEWYGLKAVESYRRVHAWIQAAFEILGITTELANCCKHSAPGQCFVGFEQFDVLWCGKKIAGAAQRRTRDGLLIQGSVQPPPLGVKREAWQSALCESAISREKLSWQKFELDRGLTERAETLVQTKYSLDGYNQKR